jgi:glyoxylase-like metal-dependent hydrolase (beta-lactamase superfamily II)
MPERIIPDRTAESMKVAARWPGADRATLVTLAMLLAGTGADAEGLRFFAELAADQPGQPLPLALAGFFGVRAGQDIPAALAKLDEAAAADLGLPQYFRGLALAGMPPEAGHAGQAVADLEFVLAVRRQLPSAMIRAVHHGLAAAYAAAGDAEKAARAAEDSGLSTAPAGARLEFGAFWANPADGFRFAAPRLTEAAPGVRVAQGYDFGDFAFLTTDAGVIAIDAGTAPERVRVALADAGLQAAHVSHVILTHSHFDHAGGIGALMRPGTTVIAQAGFPAELDEHHANVFPFRYFTGNGAGFGSADSASGPAAITPDQLVSEPTGLSVGGTNLVLYPAHGGETGDALMVYLPDSGVLLVGDVMMPYLGAPFFTEGSPEGLLETLRLITGIGPRQLVHGHIALTDVFTAESIPGLLAALSELHSRAQAGIRHGLTLTGLLEEKLLPDVLRQHPAAVPAYLVMRDHFVERLYSQYVGYWQPDGQGLEPVAPAERAAAMDLLADGKPEPFADAAQTLLTQRDNALALEIATAGLARHPGDQRLTRLRQQALHRLMERYQIQDPFRFLIYAELAGAQLGPAA